MRHRIEARRVAPAARMSRSCGGRRGALMGAKRILVVDDNPDVLRLVDQALTTAGYDVTTSPDGRSAVRDGALSLPDLVLLDIGLPDEDGFTVCAKLREKPAALDLPDHLPDRRGRHRQPPARLRTGSRRLHRQALPHQGAAGPDQGPSARGRTAQGRCAEPADGTRTRGREASGQRQDLQAGGPRLAGLAEHDPQPSAQRLPQARGRRPRPRPSS